MKNTKSTNKLVLGLLCVFVLTLLFSCNSQLNSSSVKTETADSHHDYDIFENVPLLKSDSLAIIKFDNFTSSVKTPGNTFEIKSNNDFAHNLRKYKDIQIDNITLSDTGKRVMDEGTPAVSAIIPDYAGKTINLTITGKFNTVPKIKLEHMLFTNEPGLIHQSVVGNEPQIMVILDDSILFTPVIASDKEIKVKIDTRGIPEFYLKGLHKLTVIDNKNFSDTLVKVGDPAPVTSLSPSIYSVEVLKDDEGKPVNLKLTGRNFMLYYRFSYSQIDGVFGFGHMTNVVEENGVLGWETIVHIPNIPDFEGKTEHTISYATPFGFAFKIFRN
jgi:hypothetical protein